MAPNALAAYLPYQDTGANQIEDGFYLWLLEAQRRTDSAER